jgi:hypothetical protein
MKKLILTLTALASLTIAAHAQVLAPHPERGSWSYLYYRGSYGHDGLHIEYRWSYAYDPDPVWWMQGVINRDAILYLVTLSPLVPHTDIQFMIANGKPMFWDRSLHPAPDLKQP